MAKAPKMDIPEVRKTTGSPILGNVGSAGMQYEGLRGVADELGRTSDVVHAISERKQRLKDASGSSDQHLNAIQVQNQIDADLQENRNNHEAWTDLATKRWNKHMTDLKSDLDGGGYSPEAIQRINAEAELMRVKSISGISEKQSARGYELQYTSVVMSAEELARNGHMEASKTQIRGLGLEKPEEEALIRKTLQFGDYSDAQRELQSLSTVGELEEFKEALMKRTGGDVPEEDKFVNWGHMELDGRKRLLTYAEGRIKREGISDAQTMLKLGEKFVTGKGDDSDLAEARLRGIPEELLEPYKNLYATQIATQENSRKFKTFLDRLDGTYFQRKLGRDTPDEWWVNMANQIQAENDFLPGSKKRLMDELVMAWKADVSDGELELKGMSDRDLDENEIKFHESMFDVYRVVNELGILPPSLLGGKMKQHLREFSVWYDGAERKPEEISKKLEEYKFDVLNRHYAAYNQMLLTGTIPETEEETEEFIPESDSMYPTK